MIKSILTMNDLAQERMNQASDALSKKYLNSILPIFGATKDQTPEFIGSSTYIKYKNHCYLLTAAHVMEHSSRSNLYVSNGSKLVPIQGKIVKTEKEDNKSKDFYDFAIIYLCDKCKQEFVSVSPILMDELLLSNLDENINNQGLVLGYPVSKNKNPRIYNKEKKVFEDKVNVVPFDPYLSKIILTNSIYEKLGFSKKTHCFLDFCAKHSKDEYGALVNSTSPLGVSGGGLFLVEGIRDMSETAIRDKPRYTGKLLGIIIEFHKKEKVLVCTKLTTIISHLEKNIKDLHGS